MDDIQQMGQVARVMIDGRNGPVLSGELVARSSGYFALQRGSTYDIYDSGAHKVTTLGSSDWPRRRGVYSL